MRTADALNRLELNLPEIKEFLDDRKAVFQRTAKKDDVRGEIRGSLATLRRLRQIDDAEFRALLTYYTLN